MVLSPRERRSWPLPTPRSRLRTVPATPSSSEMPDCCSIMLRSAVEFCAWEALGPAARFTCAKRE